MKEWLSEFWNSKAGFERVTRAGLFMLGSLVTAGYIPTGVSGGGSKLGPALQAIALLVKAGADAAQPKP